MLNQSSSAMLPLQWVPRVSCVIRRVLVAVGRRRRLVARCNNRLVVLIVKRVPSNRTLSSFQGAGGEVGSPPRSRGGLHWANLVWCGTAPACGYVSLHQGTAGTVPCMPMAVRVARTQLHVAIHVNCPHHRRRVKKNPKTC